MRLFYLVLLISIAPTFAATQEGIVARCGASAGIGYFFRDPLVNPDGPSWDDDAISNGHISLVRLGDEWDIQFGDTIGAYGYRQDGAVVLRLGDSGPFLTVAAIRDTYVDTFTFNKDGMEVVWTSHKIGTVVPKVGVYRADCSHFAIQIEDD